MISNGNGKRFATRRFQDFPHRSSWWRLRVPENVAPKIPEILAHPERLSYETPTCTPADGGSRGGPPRQEGTEVHSQEWNAGPERSCAPTRCMRTGTESSLGRGRFAALNHRPNERFDLVRPLHTSLLERITLTSRSRRNSRPTAWTRSGSAPTRDPIRSVQGISRRHRSAPAT